MEPEIQCHLLALATSFLLVSQCSRLGVLDGNMAVLVAACRMCGTSPQTTTRDQAARSLLVMHSMLSPTAIVPFPAISAAETARGYLEECNRRAKMDGESVDVGKDRKESTTRLEEEVHRGKRTFREEVEASASAQKKVFKEGINSIVVNENVEFNTDGEEVLQSKATEPGNYNSAEGANAWMPIIVRQREETLANSFGIGKAKGADSDDEDLELPELNLDAEPDQ